MLSTKKLSFLLTFLILGVVFFVVPIIARSSALDIKSQRQADFNQAVVSKDKHHEITPEDVKKGYVEGEVLVKFKENKIDLSSSLSDKKIHEFYQDKAVRGEGIIKEGNLALLKSDNKTTEKLISELRKDTAVEYVEPNYIYHAESIPNDPEFSKQWGLNNTGQDVNGTVGINDADIDMPEAWDFLADKSTSEVKVAVLDSGVDLNHPDLSANIIEGYDYVDNDTTPQDLYGHGTHVAGVIAALGNNSLGITGFSPNIKIIPIRIFDANGYGTADTIAAGIWEACNMGAKIINLSLGGHGFSQSMYNAISDCASQGSLFIVAAGNASDNNDVNPFYPASYDLDNIISVAATDQDDNLAKLTNYGATTVDVAAPGVNIYSTYPNLIPIFYENFETSNPPNLPNSFLNQYFDDTWYTLNNFDNSNKFTQPNDDYYSDEFTFMETRNVIDLTAYPQNFLKFNLSADININLSRAVCADWLSIYLLKKNGDKYGEYVDFITGYYSNKTLSFDLKDALNRLGTKIIKLEFGWSTGGGTDCQRYFYFGPRVPSIDNIQVFANDENGTYIYKDGTSMAVPYVSGLAALIKSYKPNYSYKAIKDNIINNVDKKDSLNGKVLSGGRINAYNSLLNVDNTPPTATFTYSTTNPTNQDVIATLAPSETVTVTNNNGAITHTFTENGSFTFEFADAAGNTGSAIATVNNIDKIAPTSTINYSTTELTNQDVIATLVPSETVTVTNNNSAVNHTFTENGSFTFEFADAAGNTGSAAATVNNIDKIAPKDPTSYSIYSDNTKTRNLAIGIIHFYPYPYFEWSGASDEGSGIKGYYVKFTNTAVADAMSGSFQTDSFFTASKITSGGTYYLHIKTIDKVGNVSPGMYLRYNFTPPKVLGSEIGEPFIVTGTKNGGGPEVRVFSTSGKLLKSFNAYPDTFKGGINVAVGDIDGNDTREIITSTREGGVPTIRVFDVEGKNLGWDFDAYDSKFRGGINIAVGDIEGDGPAEIAVAPMSGGSPNVRIFGMRNGKIVPVSENFMAYDKNFRGGIAISIGDIDGDGVGDIITTPTSRGGPHIRVFGVRNKRYVPVTLGIMAYAPTFRGGINSTVGDVNGDGREEIMTGIVSAGGPHVRIFGIKKNGTFGLLDPGFMAYNPAFRGGVSVTSIDINGDGYDEIITGVGGNGNPTVRIFNQSGKQVSKEFNAYSTNYKNGITLAAGYF